MILSLLCELSDHGVWYGRTKCSFQECQDISHRTGLLHELNLIHEDVPVDRCTMPPDHGSQLIEPQERSLLSFVMEVKAEMEEKIFMAQDPGIDSCPVLSPGSCPHRFHGGSVYERWIGQSPMRFHNEAVLRMNEFKRVGIGL